MAQPEYDPTLPADGSPIVAAELRGQFEGVHYPLALVADIQHLNLTVSNPPTQAEVQAIASRLDDLLFALQGG